MTNKGRALLLAGAVLALGVATIGYVRTQSVTASTVAASAPRSTVKAKRRILYWAAPMNPRIHSDHPMKDSMGMAYVPVYAPTAGGQAASARGGLAIDPRLRQSLGVRLVRVRIRKMGHSIHSVGTVVVDENRVYAINPRFSGWVERLTTRAVGDAVHRGEVLAWVYAPALYTAEREYFIAKVAGGARLRRAARARLRLLGLTRADIEALDRRGRPLRSIPIKAPASGVVLRLGVQQGGHISPRHDFMHIANLDHVWMNVAIYSSQLPWVRIGDPVRLRLPAYPGRVWAGHVTFLYPTLDPKTRTVTARLSIPAQGGLLKPGMFAQATVLARPRQALAVPASAVLRTRQGDFVMIGGAHGHFVPTQVELGPSNRGWTVIRRGLTAGDRVVDAAQFLLYSESQFQAVQTRMLSSPPAGDHGRRRSTPVRGETRHD